MAPWEALPEGAVGSGEERCSLKLNTIGEDLGNDAKTVFIYFQVVTETEGTLPVKQFPLSATEWISESPNLFVLLLGITNFLEPWNSMPKSSYDVCHLLSV